jgi:hypothetical protein
MELREIERMNKRWQALKNERSSWMEHWQDLSNYLLPINGRYFTADRNRGDKRYNDIYDSSGTRALRVLAAGMMSGMTSPTRPWFMLSLTDRELMEFQPVKRWLNDVSELIRDVLARSNAYRSLHSMYEELGAFGTASALMADDFESVIHMHTFTVGEYAISTDWKGDVVTLYREFDKTVGEIVQEFGRENCSPSVQNAYDLHNLDQWVTLVHAIEPRTERDTEKRDNKNMPWRSIYYEAGKQDKVLRESGYLTFPCVAPRWTVAGGDVYGASPGMESLGDIKQLQQQQFRKSQAIDYQANPPIQVPSSMKNREVETFPGGISYYDANSGTQGIKTMFEVNLNLQTLLLDIQDVRQRIQSNFFSDIFMMISQRDQRMTATEVAERHEEKMLMLGPVVERLSNELHSPLIETVFERLLTAGMLPPPPEEMQGADLNIEYISILAQAQKAVSVNSVDRFVMSLGQIAAIKPDVLDKFDSDKWADQYSDALGVDPELIVEGKQVALIRQQRAQQQQAMAQQQAMMAMAETASKAGNISTSEGTMAGDIMKRINSN